MKQPSFITIEDGIQPVFTNAIFGGGFKVVKILDGIIVAYYGDKVYRTYAGALKAANKIGGEK
jgi:hypothetical protein